jgi:hypothetical protein
MINLVNPSGLEKGQLEFSVRHRFFGQFTEKPFDTFFGLTAGAHVGLGLRYTVAHPFELN